MGSFFDGADHELCFDREIFFSRSFSVDKFVCEKRKAVGLEQLGQDLRTHLTYLQECLIELINEHYTDFVNLSSNLVGLEKFIGNISQPLTKLRDEVAEINATIERFLIDTEQKLQLRQSDRQLKGQTLLAIECYRGVLRLPAGTLRWDSELVERTALQIHSLSLSLARCGDIALAKKSAGIIDSLKVQLQEFLRDRFAHAIENHDDVELKQVLHIGTLLDRVRFLEDFYSDRFVKPALEEIVTERVLREVLSEGLFNQVLHFVATASGLLNRCASAHYDFVLHSVFPVFVTLAEARVPTLFSLTSATMFHMRYTEAQRFLETIEQHLPSETSIQKFRASPSYSKFLAKWSTGIYFQLRYTEIATNFETALLPGNSPFQFKESRLVVTENLHKQIQHCWSDGVYIECLKISFLKLTLQLVSRYTTLIEELAGEASQGVKNEQCALKYFRAAYDCLQVDDFISTTLETHLQQEEMALFKECMADSTQRLKSCSDRLADEAVGILLLLMKEQIALIQSIPRKFRKTNRPLPEEPSEYVDEIFGPVSRCRSATSLWSPSWSITLAERSSEFFLSETADLLDKVRKVKETLRLLKRGKVVETQGVSDDDKIRLQLMIDVERFGVLLDELGHRPASYEELFELAKNQTYDNNQ